MTTPATPQRPFTLTYSGEGLQARSLSSEKLSAADLDRLWRVGYGFFGIPPFLQTGPGPRRELKLTAPNGTHTVVWNGYPPPPVAEIVPVVEELSSRGPAAGRSRRGLWIGAGAGVLALAAVAVVLVLVLGGGKDPTPAVPTAVKATAGKGSVTLDWSPSKDAQRYEVQRDGRTLTTVTTTTYTDPLPNGGPSDSHRYAVVAVSDKDKKSAASTVVTSAPQLRDLNAAESTFVAKLPRGFAEVGSCKPEPAMEDPASIDVAVRCQISDKAVTSGTVKPSGGFVALHAISRDAYTSFYNQQTKGLQQSRFTCEDGNPAAANWHNRQQVDQGKIWCTTTGSSISDGRPVLGWTTLDANAFIIAYGTAGDGANGIEALQKFWNQTPYVSVVP